MMENRIDNKTFMRNVVYNNRTQNKVSFFLITFGILFFISVIYYIFDGTVFYAPIITQFLTVSIALFGLGGFFRAKDKLLKNYDRTTAYRIAFFRYHVTFIPFVYMGAIHSYFVHGISYCGGFWLFARLFIAAYLLITGITLHIKARKIFGLDNLFMYYVYHPNESNMVESIIHKIIRHPVYSAMNRIAWAGAFYNGHWIAFVLALLFTLNQLLWLSIYEEPELVERFGEGYLQFKKETPALYPKIFRYSDFVKFLIGKKK